MKSMTAYAGVAQEISQGRLTVEIQSVNRKGLDVAVYLPKDWFRFDVPIRKWVSEEIQRGQVTVRVQWQADRDKEAAPTESLKKLKSSWEDLASELGYPPSQIDLRFLLEQFKGEQVENLDFIQAPLKGAVQEALQKLILMKKKEASALQMDIEMRLRLLEEMGQKVKQKAVNLPEKYREKLRQRIQEETPLTPEMEERIIKELILFAEKIDITEELTRLRSHCEQFSSLLSSSEKSVGRTLDFLTQEMHREINTMASKSLDTELVAMTVVMKSECEKIREQIQNIE